MNVGDLNNKLDELDYDERTSVLTKLWELLSLLSQRHMLEFENGWDGRKSFAEFVTAQNKQIKLCIALEISEPGKDIRAALGLTPLSLKTKI